MATGGGRTTPDGLRKARLLYHGSSGLLQFRELCPSDEQVLSMITAYDELIDFIAGGTTPQSLIDFHPSEATKAKVADLIHRQKTGSLSTEETNELNHFLQLEHLMRMAKARARQHLTSE